MHSSPAGLLESSANLSACFERISAEKLTVQPLSTYRLQFNKEFRFEDARRLVPYLDELGISHCYASPILKARAGSTHGYDIIDHNQLNPEIGSEDEFRAFVYELKAHGMGLILDSVPNHMGVGHGNNPWWQDVLQNGRTSVYADYFDIDWEPLKPELRGKVLTPVLGKQYGEDLEQGNIHLTFKDGQFSITYGDMEFPVDPQTMPLIFEPFDKPLPHAGSADPGRKQLIQLLGELQLLPVNSTTDTYQIARRQRECPSLLERLKGLSVRSGAVLDFVKQALQGINGAPGDPHSFDALHRLLEAQVYRLAYWRVSAEEINYRRFFDINDLVGIRMEDPRVFADTHRLIRRLLGDKLVSGLRIDHPDGLLNPSQYFKRLQMLYAASQCCGPEPVPPLAENGIEVEVRAAFRRYNRKSQSAPLYVVVEKILEPGEDLPANWPVDGTVGYDFANLLNGILIDRSSERSFTNLYHRIIGSSVDVDALIYKSKKLIMDSALSSEVNVLTHLLGKISSQDRSARDFTHSVLRDAIRETIACFPVYRTYIDERGNVREWDRKYIQQAIDRAKRRNGNMPRAVFDFLRSILLLEGNDGGVMVFGYPLQLYFALKFQQLTGPVMAKGLEDTACYAYARFVPVNEVGGSPADFGVPLGEFHRTNQLRGEQWPYAMLETSTHDTKRDEDVRARLDVLSEMPSDWSASVMKWRRINRSRKIQVADGRVVPDNNEEYLLYQTIVGAWPVQAQEPDRREFIPRIQQYMQKAIREAKVNVSWINQDPEYAKALDTFIEEILSPVHHGRRSLFWDSLQKFLPSVTFFGGINSLTQTLLKLMSPGVPDIYQGEEMYTFNLVDPDNRRPVDFALRLNAIEELHARSQKSDLLPLCEDLLQHWKDGRIKQWITVRGLHHRRENPELFRSGGYVRLQVLHDRDEHVVAFARLHADTASIIAVPRLAYTLMKGHEQPPIGAVWGDRLLVLPTGAAGRPWRNVLTGELLIPNADNQLLCREVFGHFPSALLSAL